MMKFDVDRLLAQAATLASPRWAGSSGETEALNQMAAEFTAAGLAVVRDDRRGRLRTPRRRRIGLILACLWVGIAFVFRMANPRVFDVLIALGLVFVAIGGIPLGWTRGSVRAVDASLNPDETKPRLVLVARASTPPRRFEGTPRRLVFGVVVVSILIGRLVPSVGYWMGIPLFSALLTLAVEYRTNRGGPGARDNRYGLALLAETARTWPKSARSRLETHFLVLGGDRTFEADRSPDDRPTLVIELLDPGLGSTLGVVGSSEVEGFAVEAARDLWIPLEPCTMSDGLLPTAFRSADSLLVHGDYRYSTVTSVDSTALGRATSLLVEVALRWAKRHAAGSANGHRPID